MRAAGADAGWASVLSGQLNEVGYTMR